MARLVHALNSRETSRFAPSRADVDPWERRFRMVQQTEIENEIEIGTRGALGSKEAIATIAVKDLKVARAFYVGKLGLKSGPEGGPGVLSLASGSSRVLLYESELARTNKATSATWIVGGDLESIVKDLKGKGIAFEHYDMPNTKREGDIHVSGKMKVAWFKDPDGNYLSLVNG
jgi:catechol 2,3-dioxygenase-like lactoylglutathione lyase family enzyme